MKHLRQLKQPEFLNSVGQCSGFPVDGCVVRTVYELFGPFIQTFEPLLLLCLTARTGIPEAPCWGLAYPRLESPTPLLSNSR